MQIVLERQNDFWSQQMSVIHAFNTFCKYDKKYNELYSDVPMVYFDIWGKGSPGSRKRTSLLLTAFIFTTKRMKLC